MRSALFLSTVQLQALTILRPGKHFHIQALGATYKIFPAVFTFIYRRHNLFSHIKQLENVTWDFVPNIAFLPVQYSVKRL